MSKENIIQEEELKKVTGGYGDKNTDIKCQNCKTTFNYTTAESKAVWGKCQRTSVHKCPECGYYVNYDGSVYYDKDGNN